MLQNSTSFEQASFLLGSQSMNYNRMQDHLLGSKNQQCAYLRVVDHIECLDGTVVSVQASDFRACHPQNMTGPYEYVECASHHAIPHFEKFFQSDRSTDEIYVYGYVPIHVVIDFVNDHGGYMA